MTGTTQIKYERQGPAAIVTLDRPEKMNAFTRTMMDEIIAAMDEADADDAVRAVVFTGSGQRAFCAGADLTPEGGGQVFSDPNPVEDLSDERVRDGGGRLTLRLFDSKKPLISACNGVAVGVGATMQLPMDIRLASDNARYGFVFARRGIVPEAASSWFLPRAVGLQTALEWCMTGRLFDAQEALAKGLVRSVHSQGELMDEALRLVGEIADNTSAVSVALSRQLMWKLLGAEHPMEAHRLDSQGMFWTGRSADAFEGVTSFVEKRPPRFTLTPSADMPPFYPWWEPRT